MHKIAISFFSLFFAWLIAHLLDNAYQVHLASWHEIQDDEFWLFWPLIFSFLGWLVFFVPLLFIKRANSLLTHRLYFPLFGLVYGCLIFTFLIGWLFAFGELFGKAESGSFLVRVYGQAGLTGLLAGFLYSQIVHIERLNRLNRLISPLLLMILPIGLIILFFYFIPYLSPSFSYRYMGGFAGDKALQVVLEQVKVGDPIKSIDKKLPGLLSQTPACRGFVSGDLKNFRYELRFEDCRIIAVRVDLK